MNQLPEDMGTMFKQIIDDVLKEGVAALKLPDLFEMIDALMAGLEVRPELGDSDNLARREVVDMRKKLKWIGTVLPCPKT